MPVGSMTWFIRDINLILVWLRGVKPLLRWGMWTNALIGVNRFRLAYPDLYFEFFVHVHPQKEETYLAHGQLRNSTPVIFIS